jgi:hypothetical protein
MKKDHTEFKWDEDMGYAQCYIYYKNQVFEGDALCHKDDIEHKSRTVGESLAQYRATRDYLAWVRDNEVLPQLKALNQLYYSMKHSTQFNPKSYEAKMLFRQIRQKEEDIRSIRQLIADLRDAERMMIRSIERIKKLYNKKPE